MWTFIKINVMQIQGLGEIIVYTYDGKWYIGRDANLLLICRPHSQALFPAFQCSTLKSGRIGELEPEDETMILSVSAWLRRYLHLTHHRQPLLPPDPLP